MLDRDCFSRLPPQVTKVEEGANPRAGKETSDFVTSGKRRPVNCYSLLLSAMAKSPMPKKRKSGSSSFSITSLLITCHHDKFGNIDLQSQDVC